MTKLIHMILLVAISLVSFKYQVLVVSTQLDDIFHFFAQYFNYLDVVPLLENKIYCLFSSSLFLIKIKNANKLNLLINKQFNSSAVLHSNKDIDISTELQDRLNRLKSSDSNIEIKNEIPSSEEINDNYVVTLLQDGLNDFKNIAEDTLKLNEANSSLALSEEEYSNISNQTSSFSESFPDYFKEVITYEETGEDSISTSNNSEDIPSSSVFKNAHILHELLKGEENTHINKFLKEKGIAHTITHLDEYLEMLNIDKPLETDNSNKPLGKFGDYTLNDVCVKGLELAGPLKEALKDTDIVVNSRVAVDFVSFMLMYKSICYTHAKVLRYYNPSTTPMNEIPLDRMERLAGIWGRQNRRFKMLGAPLLLAGLYTIKQVIVPSIVNVKSVINVDMEASINPSGENSGSEIKNSLFLLGAIKKLPNLIKKIVNIVGTMVVSIGLIQLIKFILEKNSINIFQPFYVKMFFLFSIVLFSIFVLDYLVKYLLFLYFIKNKDIQISKKLPAIIYNYLDEIKTVSEISASYKNMYIYYLVIYFLILLFFIGSYLFIIP